MKLRTLGGELGDRLAYAAIGFVFGAIFGAVLWVLYGLALSRNLTPGNDPVSGVLPWIKVVGGGFAVLGFLLKGRVGDLLGDGIAAVYAVETLEYSRWFWVVGLLVVGLLATWMFFNGG